MLNDLFEETWKELKCGYEAKEHPFRSCCLATYDKSGKIKQRTVNLRLLTDEKNLLFYTDIRSGKIKQLRENPGASVLFYNPLNNLQISLCGKVVIHEDTQIWTDHYISIEGRSLNDYNTEDPPGKPIRNPLNVRRTKNINFAVLEFVPDCIEYLKLRQEPNRIRAYFELQDKEWKKTFLVP